MTDEKLKAVLDECGCHDDRGCNTVRKLAAEVDRLRRGDFTEEEFQGLCHKFQEADACRFAQGCVDYNRKLFGDESRLTLAPPEAEPQCVKWDREQTAYLYERLGRTEDEGPS